MIKGVIFDLDDTLYDYKAANQHAIEGLCQRACELLQVDRQTFLDAFGEGRQSTKRLLGNCAAKHNRMLYCQKALELLGQKPASYALEMYDAYWNSFLEQMQLYDGVLNLVELLRKRQVKIAICTDLTVHIQHRKLKKMGLDKYIDYLVTSEEVGIEKPDERMFLTCLQKMKLRPEEVIFIGDDLKKDIEGAHNVGMTPIWYNAKNEIQDEEYLSFTNYVDGIVEKICCSK